MCASCKIQSASVHLASATAASLKWTGVTVLGAALGRTGRTGRAAKGVHVGWSGREQGRCGQAGHRGNTEGLHRAGWPEDWHWRNRKGSFFGAYK